MSDIESSEGEPQKDSEETRRETHKRRETSKPQSDQERAPAQRVIVETIESAPTIEAKLEEIKEQVALNTYTMLRVMGISESKLGAYREAMSKQTAGSIGTLRGALDAIEESLKDTSGEVNKGELLAAYREIKESLDRFSRTQEGLEAGFLMMADVQQRQLQIQESQLPPALHIPTREGVVLKRADRYGEDPLDMQEVRRRARALSTEEYETEVRDWFEKTLREIGKHNVQFEERPQLLTPLLLTVSHLELDPETRALGVELRELLDAHRIDKGMTRIWDLVLPDQIGGAASQVHITKLRTLFTTGEVVINKRTGKPEIELNSKGQPIIDEETGEPKIKKRYRITEKFQELEKRGNEISRLYEGFDVEQINGRWYLLGTYRKDKDGKPHEDNKKYEVRFDKRNGRVEVIIGGKRFMREWEEEIVKDGKRVKQRREEAVQWGEHDVYAFEEDGRKALHIWGIHDYKVEERAISEQRDRKGRFKRLTSGEQKRMQEFVTARKKLEDTRDHKIQDINEIYREGGLTMKTDIENLEKQRRAATLELQKAKEAYTGKSPTLKPGERRTETEKEKKLRRLEGLRNKRSEGKPLTAEERDGLRDLENTTGLKQITRLIKQVEDFDKQYDDLEDDRQAMLTAGGMHRYLFRAARHDIQYMTGNFFSGRALHLGSRVEDRYPITKGIITPVANRNSKYFGKTLDFGGKDYLENLFISRAKVDAMQKIDERIRDLQGKASLSEDERKELKDLKEGRGDAIRNVLTKRKTDTQNIESYGIRVIRGSRLNLENADLHKKQLWDDILQKYGVVDNWYVADQIDEYNKIDKESRGVIWKDGSWWQDPNIESFLAQRGTQTHMSQDQKKAFFGEVVDRTNEWYKDDYYSAVEAVEDLALFPDGEKFALIEEASKAEMMTNAFRDEMYKKHLPFPGFGSPRDKAQMRVFWDTVFSIWRYKPMRNQIAMDSFWNMIKRMFSYTFAEEAGR